MKCIEKLKNMIKHLPNNYPNIDEDINYIWNTLPEEMEEFSYDELVDNNYKINELVITYLLELSQLYKNIKSDYEIDETMYFYGSGGYDIENNKIRLSVMTMMIIADNIVSYLRTIFHELRHAYQNKFYNEENIDEIIKYDPELIIVLKHHIYKEYHDIEDFYDQNYHKLYPEVDADINSLKDIENLVKDLIKDNNLKTQILDDLNDIEKLNINPQTKLELTTNTPIRTYLKVRGKEEDSLILIDKFIKDNPTLIDTYKPLQLLFNGYVPKTYDEIIKERNSLLKKYKDTEYFDNIYRLYQNIIRTDPMYQLRDHLASNNIDGEIEFLSIHPTLTAEYNDEFMDTIMRYQKIKNNINK